MKIDQTPAGRRVRLPIFFLTLVSLILLLLLLPPGATAQEEPIPQTTPDAGAGMDIFLERCANCHGPLGLGDGELAPELPRPPAPIGTEEYLRQAVPTELFETITTGIAQAGMPPFGPTSSNPLSEEARWHAVAALYSLGMPTGSLEEGQAIYEAACADCHGADGVADEIDLTAAAYWATHSNEAVFTAISSDENSEHAALEIGEDDLWAVINYARTFSYNYASPMEAFAPIEVANVRGAAVNQTTGEPLESGIPAVLNAFTPSFEPSLTMTTTLSEGGTFDFNLTMVPNDLLYVVTVEYDGLSYGSDFAEIDRSTPLLELPVDVYEQTTDPAAVVIDQLHVILEFGGEQVQVNELYQFSQGAPTVYVGAAGDPSEGTVEIVLPEGAANPTFERTFGSAESFFPAENIVQTEDGWADTVPLRPGQGALNLLVRYSLPYESGMEIIHPVKYDVSNVNLVMTDAGVSLVEDDAWVSQGAQSMGAGVFSSYSRAGVLAGEEMAFSLEGEPTGTGANVGGAAPERDQMTELLVGAGVLLLTLAVAIYLIRLWQQKQEESELAPVAVGKAMATTPEEERETLLAAIAGLDDAYAAGDLEEGEYRAQRQELKERLVAIWGRH